KTLHDRFVDRARVIVHASHEDGIEDERGCRVDTLNRRDYGLEIGENILDISTDRRAIYRVPVFLELLHTFMPACVMLPNSRSSQKECCHFLPRLGIV